MEFDRLSLEAWQRDQPLSILQLDPADRAVLRIAGKHTGEGRGGKGELFSRIFEGHSKCVYLLKPVLLGYKVNKQEQD